MNCGAVHFSNLLFHQRGIDPNVDDPTQCHVSHHSPHLIDVLCSFIIEAPL